MEPCDNLFGKEQLTRAAKETGGCYRKASLSDVGYTAVSTPSLRAQRSNPGCFLGKILDCSAEPIIGPRARTRWLAMTESERRRYSSN
jgi:hypothetical protein